jgi:DNA-binding MarR family transcriptional regulator
MSLDRRRVLECADCLCLASRKAARAITRAYDRQLRAHGLRATQFTVLAMLELKGPQPIGELARALGTERTTLTRNLALIEEQSLVTMRPGDDARERIVAITPEGRKVLERALPAWRKAQEEITGSIGAPLADSLRRLARAPGL